MKILYAQLHTGENDRQNKIDTKYFSDKSCGNRFCKSDIATIYDYEKNHANTADNESASCGRLQ